MKRSKPSPLSRLINRIPGNELDLPFLKMRLISSFLLMISCLVRLLLIACREAVSAFCPAASKNTAATFCSHPCAETELPCPLHLARMIGSLAFVTHIDYSKFIAVKRLFSSFRANAQLWDSIRVSSKPSRYPCHSYSFYMSVRKSCIEVVNYSP